MRAGADPDATEPVVSLTALMHAAAMGDLPLVDALLGAGADATRVGEQEGRTALDRATAHGHAVVAERLRDHLASKTPDAG